MNQLPLEITDKRINACVRACEGLPTELLADPEYSIKAELDTLDEQIAKRLEAERRLSEVKE